MSNESQIRQLIEDYTTAAAHADMDALRSLCTASMHRQFTFTFRLGIRLTRLLMPGRMRNLAVDDLEIEKMDGQKAVISYTTTFGKRRCYERTVLLKQDGRWKIDGKYA